jgi:DNA-directed RNA polymerase I subunit RPA2
MEDAMIINKASYERGFAHGSVYKSEFIELKSVSCNCNKVLNPKIKN